MALVATLWLTSAVAQADSDRPEEWPITLELNTSYLGFYPRAFHPGVAVGTEIALVQEGAYSLLQSVRLGLVHHPELMSGGYLDTQRVNRGTFDAGPYAELGIGVGYQLTGTPATTYASNEEGFAPGGNDPRSMARVMISLAIGFDFREVTVRGLRVYLRWDEILLTPFAPGNTRPLFVSAQISLGVAVPLSPDAWAAEAERRAASDASDAEDN